MLPEISFFFLFCAETSKVSVLHTYTINLDKILYFHLIFFFNPKQDQFLKLKKKRKEEVLRAHLMLKICYPELV